MTRHPGRKAFHARGELASEGGFFLCLSTVVVVVVAVVRVSFSARRVCPLGSLGSFSLSLSLSFFSLARPRCLPSAEILTRISLFCLYGVLA